MSATIPGNGRRHVAPEHPEAGEACFVVSTGRCGSTYLSEILNQHPEILSISEFLHAMGPSPFPSNDVSGRELSEMFARVDPYVTAIFRRHEEPAEWLYPVEKGRRFNRETGVPAIAVSTLPHLIDDPDPTYDDLIAFATGLSPAPVARQYMTVFDWLRHRFGGRRWVERSGGSLELLPSIMSRFPGARYIHLHRDGREAAISMREYDRSLRGLPRLLLAAARYEWETGTNPIAATGPPAGHLPQPLRRLVAEVSGVVEPTPETVEWFGRHWSTAILRGLRQLRRIPEERVLQIAYEDLVTDTSGTLHRVATFLGVDASSSWIAWAESASQPPARRWPALAEPERTRLEAVCRIANRRLYGAGRSPAMSL